MPQRRGPRPADPAVVAQRMADQVRAGVPNAGPYLTPSAQIQRLGVKEVQRLTAEAGVVRSERTIRRWRQQGRVPHDVAATVIKRADQVDRLGGDQQASAQLGQSPDAVQQWVFDPAAQLPPPAEQHLTNRDRAEGRSRAGIPCDPTGKPLRLPKLRAGGSVWVKGTSKSDEYIANRVVGDGEPVVLDEDTTEALLASMEGDNPDAAREAVEAFLSKNYADCDDYGADSGWHFDDLDYFEVNW